MPSKKSLYKFPEVVDILGTLWEIKFVDYNKDPYFDKFNADGYCSSSDKMIVICNPSTNPTLKDETDIYISECIKEILRHELVHALLYECGLGSSTLKYGGGWAKNEEMVDWIANNGDKLYKLWEKCGCLKRPVSPDIYMKWKKESES